MTRAHADLRTLVIAGLAAAIALAGCGEEPADQEPKENPVDSGDLLKRQPHMGVSCRTANSIACDRVGLAVWLREPAERVSATVGGRQFELDDPEWSGPVENEGRRSLFAGFLQPAGLDDEGSALQVEPAGEERWYGRPPVSAKLSLAIEPGEGERLVTEVEVPLQAGWG